MAQKGPRDDRNVSLFFFPFLTDSTFISLEPSGSPYGIPRTALAGNSLAALRAARGAAAGIHAVSGAAAGFQPPTLPSSPCH